jgi:hypothetical protein
MNDFVIIRGDTPEFRAQLVAMGDEGAIPEREPLTFEQRRELATLSAAERVRRARHIRLNGCDEMSEEERAIVARGMDDLIGELSEAAALLRRRRVDVNDPPQFLDPSVPKLMRRQAGGVWDPL